MATLFDLSKLFPEAGVTKTIKVVAKCEDGGYTQSAASNTVVWTKAKYNDIEIVCDAKFSIVTPKEQGWDGAIYYCTDRTAQEQWTVPVVAGTPIESAQIGETGDYHVYLRGEGNTVITGGREYEWGFSFESTPSTIKVIGRAESLLDYKLVEKGQHPTVGTEAFAYMFAYIPLDVDYSELILDCHQLSEGCYRGMFYDNDKLTSAHLPILPEDVIMAESCCASMFEDCVSLEYTPNFPSQSTAPNCYYRMFAGCISLSAGPESLASNLSESCYRSMFYRCYNLAEAPKLPATTLAPYCYQGMFERCIALSDKKLPTLAATELAVGCYDNMFASCSGLINLSNYTLPATNVIVGAYNSMFLGCNNLVQAPVLKATVMGPQACTQMFAYCEKLTTLPTLNAMSLSDACYAEMFLSCSSLTTLPNLPATHLPSHCYERMFADCESIRLTDIEPAQPTGTFMIPYTTDIGEDALTDMFVNTAGTMAGTPVAGIQYWLFANADFVCFRANTFFSLYVPVKGWNGAIEYSTNPTVNANWKELEAETLVSCAGHGGAYYLYLRGIGNTHISTGTDTYWLFTSSDSSPWEPAENVQILSNMEYLLDYTTVASGKHPEMDRFGFRYMFAADSSVIDYNGITDISGMTLPLESLPDTTDIGCYEYMFAGCSKLTTAMIELPAQKLSRTCYASMFEGCSSLVNPPELPATSLEGASYCYQNMFKGCTSLDFLPDLNATTLSEGCYMGMFQNSGVTRLLALPATGDIPDYCYNSMFAGCEIALSDAASELYPNAWRLPPTGEITVATLPEHAIEGFIDNPPENFTVNTTYYEFNASSSFTYLRLYSEDIFTITSPFKSTLWYSTNLASWSEWKAGESVKATTCSIAKYKDTYNVFIRGTGNSVVSGAVGEGFVVEGKSPLFTEGALDVLLDWQSIMKGVHPTPGASAFANLFQECYMLINPPELWTDFDAINQQYPGVLPSGYVTDVYLSEGCYANTFRSCANLRSLPSMRFHLVGGEYQKYGVPDSCCYYMFADCTSLTEADVIKDTDGTGLSGIGNAAFEGMYYGCAGLVEMKHYDVEGIPTPVALDQETDARCYYQMFAGGVGQKTRTGAGFTPPAISSTKIENCACYGMFEGAHLTEGAVFTATRVGENGCERMYANVYGPVIYPDFGVSSVDYAAFRECFAGNVSIERAPELGPITTAAAYCCYNMYSGSEQLKVLPTLTATTLNECCYEGMFSKCTSVKLSTTTDRRYPTAFRIPATGTTGADPGKCAAYMFQGTTGRWPGEAGEGTPTFNITYYSTDANSADTWGTGTSWNETWFQTYNNAEFYTKVQNELKWYSDGEVIADTDSMSTGWGAKITFNKNSANTIFNFTYAAKVDSEDYNTVIRFYYTDEDVHEKGFYRVTTNENNTEVEKQLTARSYHLPGGYAGIKTCSSAFGKTGTFIIGVLETTSPFLETEEYPFTDPEPEEDRYIDFNSSDVFTLALTRDAEATRNWSGEVYYSFDGVNWLDYSKFTRPTITASYSLKDDKYHIYMVGEEVTGFGDSSHDHWSYFTITSNALSGVACDGDIRGLLDWRYDISMDTYAFAGLFYGCTKLLRGPELPSTELTEGCYYGMYSGCTNLQKVPALPATVLPAKCYYRMFYNCSDISYYETQTLAWQTPFRIPETGTCESSGESWGTEMLGYYTSGSYSQPNLEQTYYIKSSAIPDDLIGVWTEDDTQLGTVKVPGSGLKFQENGVVDIFQGHGYEATSGWFVSELGHSTTFNYSTATSFSVTATGSEYGDSFTGTWSGSSMTITKSGGATVTLTKRTDYLHIPTVTLNGRVATVTWPSTYAYAHYFDWTTNAYAKIYNSGETVTIPDDKTAIQVIGGKYLGTNLDDGITEARTYKINIVADPTITFSDPTVTIACGTSGSTIHYTIDGSTPTAESTTYTAPFDIAYPTTVKAIAMKDTYVSSAVVTLTPEKVATPDISQEEGSNLVTISCETTGATIWYKIGESGEYEEYDPDTGITITEECVVFSIAKKSGMFNSDETSKTCPYTPSTSTPYVKFVNTSTSASTVSLAKNGEPHEATFQYSTDDTNDANWTDYTLGTGIDIPVGGMVCFRGTASDEGFSSDWDNSYQFTDAAGCDVSGNIMGLLDGGTGTTTEIPCTGCFSGLFGNTNIVSASNLELPATTLASGCYYSMFYQCYSLTSAPALPATELATYCYNWMFGYCTSLTDISNCTLPATTLAQGCYNNMFRNCTSLTTAPALPATTLANYCYWCMFCNCTSLVESPELPAIDMGSEMYGQYTYMFYECTSLVKAGAIKATTLGCADSDSYGCCEEMFYGCTSLTNAPIPPATALTSGCYYEMFYGCTSLKYYPDMSDITTLAEWCCSEMFYGSGILAITSLPDAVLVNGCYNSMFADCDDIYCDYNEPTAYSTSIFFDLPEIPSGVEDCYTNMFPTDEETIGEGTWYNEYYPLTFESQNANGFSIKLEGVGNPESVSLEYMINWNKEEGWKTYTPGNSIDVDYSGGYATISFRGNNLTGFNKSTDKYWHFVVSGKGEEETPDDIAVYGWLTSLVNYTTVLSTLPNQYCFYKLFSGCEIATIYSQIFNATTLSAHCYDSMFEGCTNLTASPALPAVTLAESCYEGMFRNCTGITAAPVLRDLVLPNKCYYQMFRGTGIELYQESEKPTSYRSYRIPVLGIATVSGMPAEEMFPAKGTWGGTVTANTTYYSEKLACLCLTAQAASDVISISNGSSANIEYSIDDGENWDTWANDVTLSNVGDELYLRGNNPSGLSTSTDAYVNISTSALTSVSGNVMSLIDTTLQSTTIPNTYCFYRLFYQSGNVTTVPTLPATSLTAHCYEEMFRGCTSITAAPALPAETLAEKCYYQMFYGCTGLTTVSTISAATLVKNCCDSMFYGCTALTTVPATLPAMTLATECYKQMFYGCSNLATIPSLPATTLAEGCYREMFRDCTSLTTPPVLSATTLDRYCYTGMFRGCTSLTTSPTLSATTVKEGCYMEMFYNCTSLTAAPELPATTLDKYCYSGMFNSCYALTTPPALPAETLEESCYDTMFYLSGITTLPELPATTLADYCYQNMFTMCNSLTDVSGYTLPATTLGKYCYSGMFDRCSNLTKPPVLPTTAISIPEQGCNQMFYSCTKLTVTPAFTATLSGKESCKWMFYGCTALTDASGITINNTTEGCCNAMFRGCTNLTAAPTLSATTVAESSYYQMFYNCASLQTTPSFSAALNGLSSCYGMFYGCTALTNASGITISAIASDATQACYEMFRGCTSLTAAPTLSTTTVTSYCYCYMFSDCTSLETSPALPATDLTGATCCYSNMFRNCQALKTVGAISATTLAAQLKENGCMSYMFVDCKALTSIPVINVSTTTGYCYSYMFQNCTSLADLSSYSLPATTLASSCYSHMFQGCTRLTTPPVLPATTLASNCYENMFQGCTSLTSAPTLNVTTLASSCYDHMFQDCTSLTTAPALPATTATQHCYKGMFYECTSLTAAPELPATTLDKYCYLSMFEGCTSLTTPPTLPAETLAPYCYQNMFNGCTSLQSIPKIGTTSSSSSLPDHCCYGMFSNCTQLYVGLDSTIGTAGTYTILGTVTSSTDKALTGMFAGCMYGSQATPSANTTYYSNLPVI